MNRLAGWLLLLSLVLGACGQTGDLYWPQEEQQTIVEDDEADAG